ncbi:hypothetical protein AVI51_07620 [Piscirickettsia salmonis]|uniref:Uncharacterized protein n=1 Tax=Piscirickettsia salmonis TaxID=1238 RepID=A0A9Q5YG69_PISSA|nr:hypothetical protein KW89_2485 [Piscirickettsia salmonis]APS43409.1 hypothetical protein AVI48_02835 [Piscirickettsia salmonis]APS46760.1 hypothetical protein AVI49_03440 [Piscirickettsia salmonis]APS50734.1 hypothetical protein AVI50_07705 [Piscirickettsia salmonis]APS53940.1 hypothetical protein AVI51_07620 [Piscirickettsia salmonis]
MDNKITLLVQTFQPTHKKSVFCVRRLIGVDTKLQKHVLALIDLKACYYQGVSFNIRQKELGYGA